MSDAPSTIDGLLVIDKPEGPTSHDIVARVRRLLNTPRVGHTGTLDPMATGVLPLVLGRATRLARFLTSSDKQYRAVVRLGQATDTYDRLGEAAGPALDVRVTPEEIEAQLAAFRGEIVQTPPPYSAKKIGGVSAHRLARRGEAVTPAPVTVTVRALTLTAWDDAGTVTLDVHCSAGFYVRSLAHDLGQALGCGAHLVALRRTASGALTEREAHRLDPLQQDAGAARAAVIPMAQLLPDFPTVQVSAEGAVRVGTGQRIRSFDLEPGSEIPDFPDLKPGQEWFVRVLGPDGSLLALAAPAAGGLLHPSLVLA
jgi:tRNA pseudouridine55 synthase